MWKKFAINLKGGVDDHKVEDTNEFPDDISVTNLDLLPRNLNLDLPPPPRALVSDNGRYQLQVPLATQSTTPVPKPLPSPKTKPEHSSLGLMTIEVEVYRQGDVHSPLVETPQVHIATIHRPHTELPTHNPKSYSWDEFMRVFDQRLDENPFREPTQIKYGKVGYFTNKGDHKEVSNQKGFEKAIEHLYVNRGGSDVLKFIFQPEHHDKMVKRIEEEQKVIDKLGREMAEKEKIEEDRRAKEEEKRLAEEVKRLVVEAKRSPKVEGSRPGTAKSEGQVLEQVLSNQSSLPGSPKITTPRSRAPSPIIAIQRVLKKVGEAVAPTKQVPETRAERTERLRGLFEEEERKSFKKGGNEVGLLPLPVDRSAEETDAEEEGDDAVSQEDRIAGQLQKLLNLKSLVQLSGPNDKEGTFPRWEESCEMFGCDPFDTEIGKTIKIAGLKTQIYQYQAHGVYWQMLNSRSMGGGFVADDMGLGKTLSYLAYIVVERQLSVLWREVDKSRSMRDGKHLLASNKDANAKCPQFSMPGWIMCPCASSSPTSKMARQPGLRMACVPPALVSGWWGQWKAHVDTADTTLNMRIVVDHAAAFNEKSTMEDMKCKSTISPVQNRIRADAAGKDAKVFDRPKEYQDGYLILTTKENFPKLAEHFKAKGQVKDPKKPNKPGEWISGNRIALVFGIAMIDESHEEYFKGKGRGAILAKLPTYNCNVAPFIWGYSGTPISQTPRGLEGVLHAIEKHSKVDWTTDGKFRQFQWKELDAICKRFDAQIKSIKRDDAAVTKILADFEPFLVNFMIRRTSSTDWFGHTLMKLKPHFHQDIRLKENKAASAETAAFEAQFDGDRQAQLEKLQADWDNFPEKRRSDIRPTMIWFNTMVRENWRSRLMADFPALVKLAKSEVEENRLNLTEDEVIDFFRSTNQKENATPYGRSIKNIVETSPKCLWLYDFITQLNAQKDIEGNVEKLVILTAFPQAAFILKLFIQRYFPEDKDRVGVITQRMKASERQFLIDCFSDPKDEKQNPKYKREIKFLIGTTLALGKGLGLTRARNVVLMEPDNFTTESQAYGRVDRIGQKNPISRSYRLIDMGSEIEQKIIKRQVDRNESYGRPVGNEEVVGSDVGLGITM